MQLFRLQISKLNAINNPERRECFIQSVQLTQVYQELIETLNKELQIDVSGETEICNPSSKTILIFYVSLVPKLGLET